VKKNERNLRTCQGLININTTMNTSVRNCESDDGSSVEGQPTCVMFDPLTNEERLFLESQSSTTIKFMFMKFKCIIVLSVSLLAFCQFIYIIVKEIHASIETSLQMSELIKILFEEKNHTKEINLKNITF
jgi:hypothetical protein